VSRKSKNKLYEIAGIRSHVDLSGIAILEVTLRKRCFIYSNKTLYLCAEILAIRLARGLGCDKGDYSISWSPDYKSITVKFLLGTRKFYKLHWGEMKKGGGDIINAA